MNEREFYEKYQIPIRWGWMLGEEIVGMKKAKACKHRIAT